MSLEQITVKLPALNGETIAGIATQTERSLVATKQLEVICRKGEDPTTKAGKKVEPVLWTAKDLNDEQTIKGTLLQLLARCKKTKRTEKEISILIPGAFIVMRAGCLATRVVGEGTTIADGDWYTGYEGNIPKESFTDDSSETINALLTESNLTLAATLLVATKINWYKENHHTGQGKGSGHFIKKVINATMEVDNVDDVLQACYELGHWASTRVVLTQLGLEGVRESQPFIAAVTKIVPTDDVKLRINAPPAGTGRLAISYHLARRMLASPISILCPNVDDYSVLPAAYVKMMGNKAGCHIGAAYLTGRPPQHQDAEFGSFLGRAGSYGKAFIPNNSLMQSPHAMAYKNADDFDPEFDIMCVTFRSNRSKAMKKKLETFNKIGLTVSAGYAELCEAFGIAPNAEAMSVIEEVQKDNPVNDDAESEASENEEVAE